MNGGRSAQAPQNTPAPGSVVIVTGGAYGIGREYCRAFAAVGARVVVADVDGAGADSVAQEIGGTDIAVVRADVSDEASVTSLADTAIRRFGRVVGFIKQIYG